MRKLLTIITALVLILVQLPILQVIPKAEAAVLLPNDGEFRWPTSGIIGQIYDQPIGYELCSYPYKHKGIDIWTHTDGSGNDGTRKGNPVYPIAPGEVDFIDNVNGVNYGIRIKHNNGTWSHYYHMASGNSSFIEDSIIEGTVVDQNTLLGYQGDLTTIGSVDVHLDLVITTDGVYCNGVDPSPYFTEHLNYNDSEHIWYHQNSVEYSPYQEDTNLPPDRHVTSQVFRNRLYQAYTDQENRVRTRSTVNGGVWVDLPSDGLSAGNVSMVEYTPQRGVRSRLYQAVRGISGNLFMRYSEDGKNWKNEAGGAGWQNYNIETKGDIDMIVAGDPRTQSYIYQSIITTDNKLAMRYKKTGMINDWSSWKIFNTIEVEKDSDISIEKTNNVDTGLFITAIQKDTNKIVSQRFWLGELPNDHWQAWIFGGQTDSDIASVNYKGNTYQFVNGNVSDKIFSRNMPTSTTWREELGETKYGSSLVVFKPKRGSEMLVQSVKGTSNTGFIRTTSENDFSTSQNQWINISEDEIEGRPDLAVYKNLLFNTILIRDKSNHIVPKTRVSVDGVTWRNWVSVRINEDWELQKGNAAGNITSVVYKNRLYQALRGNSSSQIYMRSTQDGVFDPEVTVSINGGEEEWVPTGTATTGTDINMVVYGGRLYQVMGGQGSGVIYVRSTRDGVFDDEADEKWYEIKGMLAQGNIEIELFRGYMYFTLVKKGTNQIYMAKNRGHITSAKDLNWELQEGNTLEDVNMEVHRGYLYQVVTGATNTDKLFIRATRDGVFNSDSEKWKELTGIAVAGNATLQTYKNRLNIFVRTSDNAIESTQIIDLRTLSPEWKSEYGHTSKDVEMVVFRGSLYQTIRARGEDETIYLRSSKDGVFDLNR